MLLQKCQLFTICALLALSKTPSGEANFLRNVIRGLTDLTKEVVEVPGEIAQALLTGPNGLTGVLGQVLDNAGKMLENVNTVVSTVTQDFTNFTDALGEAGDCLTGVIDSIKHNGNDIGASRDKIFNARALIVGLENSLRVARNEALGNWSISFEDLMDCPNPAAFGELFKILAVLDTVRDTVKALAQGLALIVNGLSQLLANVVEDAISVTLGNWGTSLEEQLQIFAIDLLQALYNEYESHASQYLVQDPTQVKFFLCPNAKNASTRVPLQWTRNGLTSAGFKTNLPIILIVEGLVTPENPSGGSDVLVEAYTAANVTARTANVIVVNWNNVTGTFNLNWPGYLSVFPQYVHDVYNVKFVARIISNFLVFLSNTTISSGSTSKFIKLTSDGYVNVHVVGPSIGAHVGGVAAQMYTVAWSKTIYRISAVDPAGPLFSDAIPGDCFASNQAKYTDAIYTNRIAFGMPEGQNVAMANVDINGGFVQSTFCGYQDIYYPCSHFAASHNYAMTIGIKIPATCKVGTCNISAIGEQIPLTAAGDYNANM